MNGKLSEGINFSNELGRGVFVVGLPYPNIHELEVKENIASYTAARMEEDTSLDKQRLQAEFLENACMRVVNQSIGNTDMSELQNNYLIIIFLGRAIRHKDDYAAMFLIDERFSRESVKAKLPDWLMRGSSSVPNYTYPTIEPFSSSLNSVIQVKMIQLRCHILSPVNF